MPSEFNLHDFVEESNRIEGIFRVTEAEIEAHELFLAERDITVGDMQQFVWTCANAELREHPGMNVFVGNHEPPQGGPQIRTDLADLLAHANAHPSDLWQTHIRYETLHPFMDGNGRSGRVLWLWMFLQHGREPQLPFLHHFYYQTLDQVQRGERQVTWTTR